jgi:transposase
MSQENKRKIWSLYLITNLITKKIYIGQTNDPKRRWMAHKSSGKTYNSALSDPMKLIRIRKKILFVDRRIGYYGANNFNFELVASCISLDDANEMEILLIKQYGSHISLGKGYNKTWGGNASPSWNKGTKGQGICKPNSGSFSNGHIPWLKGTNIQTSKTFLKGSKHVMAKLTEEKVLEIVKSYNNGSSAKELGIIHNIGSSSITDIISGRRWGHITGIIQKPVKKQNKLNWKSDAELIELLNKYGVNDTAKLLNIKNNVLNRRISTRKLQYKRSSNKKNEKLNKNQVIEIVKQYQNGISSKELAIQFSVHISTIQGLVNGKQRSHITGIIPNPNSLKGFPAGSAHKSAKLTEEQVLQIVQLAKTGNYTQEKLAFQFGVNAGSIAGILSGRKWKHLTGIQYQRNLSAPRITPIKLTNQQVLQIIQLYNTKKYTQRQLAKQFGIGKTTVAKIINGKSWSHLTGIKPQSK